MSRSLFAFWDVLSCYIHSCFISPISSGSFPYMNRSFHIRQFCPIPGSWTSILHYGTCQISCLFLYSHDIVNLRHCDMYFYIFIGGFFSPLVSLCIVLFLEYLFLIIIGAIAAFKEKKISKNEIYY